MYLKNNAVLKTTPYISQNADTIQSLVKTIELKIRKITEKLIEGASIIMF